MNSVDAQREETELNYKAYLANVTTKRKTHPEILTKLLTNTMKVERITIEKMHVELPIRTQLYTNNSSLESNIETNYEESGKPLNQVVVDVQPLQTNMANILDAFKIMNNNNPNF